VFSAAANNQRQLSLQGRVKISGGDTIGVFCTTE